MRRAALALLLVAGAAAAEERVGPEAFEALSAGRTLYFTDEAGRPMGAEQYLPDRRVIWQTPDGACLTGRWRGEAGEICFAYDDAPDLWRCWEVGREAGRLYARLRGEAEALWQSGESAHALVCDGLDRPV